MEVLYGLHPVEEAIRAGGRRLDYVLVSRERTPRLDKLVELCKIANVRVSYENKDQLTRIARTDAHQGAVAAVRDRQFLTIEDLLAARGRFDHKFFLALGRRRGRRRRAAAGAPLGSDFRRRRQNQRRSQRARPYCPGDEYNALFR